MRLGQYREKNINTKSIQSLKKSLIIHSFVIFFKKAISIKYNFPVKERFKKKRYEPNILTIKTVLSNNKF